MKFMVFLLLASVLGLSAVVGIQFGQISRSRAEARAHNALVWHAVICSIEHSVLQSKTISDKQKIDVVKFYDNLLINDVGTTGCGL